MAAPPWPQDRLNLAASQNQQIMSDGHHPTPALKLRRSANTHVRPEQGWFVKAPWKPC
jgi:hypothetical protein